MSLLVLDAQLTAREVVEPLAKRHAVVQLSDLRPRERVLDDRVLQILRTLNRPTFLTIDRDFWDRELCHPSYAILCFEFDDDRAEEIPEYVRKLFLRPDFRTRAKRMGKVARITTEWIDWWQFGDAKIHRLKQI